MYKFKSYKTYMILKDREKQYIRLKELHLNQNNIF